jgi:hypothetical protein
LAPPKLTVSHFTVEDRGAGAGIAEPAGVMRNEPVAVAGRGKLAAKLFNPISLGRGVENSLFLCLSCSCQI